MAEPAAADRISVVLPYHNRADSLERAIASVLQQTYRNILLVLVDDCSTDTSNHVAKQFNDARVLHVRLPGNVGASGARNAGLDATADRHVAFMDSDDVWRPRKLEIQLRYLQTVQSYSPLTSVVGCGWSIMGRSWTVGRFAAGPFSAVDVLANRVAGIGTPMLLIDRSVANAGAAFDVNLKALEDRDYVISCLSNGTTCVVVDEELALVDRGRHDHLANPDAAAAAYAYLLEKYSDRLANSPELMSSYAYRACREFVLAGAPFQARPHLREALQTKAARRLFHLGCILILRGKGAAIAQRLIPL